MTCKYLRTRVGLLAVLGAALLVGCGGGGGGSFSSDAGTGTSQAPAVSPGGTTSPTGPTGSTGTGTTASIAWTDRMYGQGTPTSMVWNGSAYISHEQLSTDGKYWQSNDQIHANAIAWDGALYISVKSNWVDVSTDGRSWTSNPLPSAVLGNQFYAIVKSPTTWVAVGAKGSIIYSSDGKTWSAAAPITINTASISGYAPALNAVTWTGSQFVAGGESGALATSPDGITWTVKPGPNTDTIKALASKNGLVIASTFPYPGSTPALLTSPDGANFTWTQRLALTAVQIINAGGKWVAIGDTRTSATSPDGLAWTIGSPFTGMFNTVVYNGAEYVASGIDRNSVGSIFYSPDGLAWNYRLVTSRQTAAAISPVDGRIVAGGTTDSSRTSLDSATWDFGTLDANYPFLDITWTPSSNKFTALVEVSANQYAYSSVDGKTWARGAYAPCGYLGATLVASPTVMINAGASLSGPCLATSTDGAATWTSRTSPVPSGESTTKAFWTGSQFVLLGSSGTIATSPAGDTWTRRASGTTRSLNGGASSPATIVVVGTGGTILTSSDAGSTWTAQSSGTIAKLNRVVWTGTQFYAVGTASTLLSSPDGVSWTPVATSYSAWPSVSPFLTPPDFNEVVWSPTTGKLTVFGDGGLVATVP